VYGALSRRAKGMSDTLDQIAADWWPRRSLNGKVLDIFPQVPS